MPTIIFSEDGRDFVGRHWTHLVHADPAGTFFHSPAYLKLYWEEFGGGFDLLLAFAEEEGRTVGACAFERSGRELRFLGGTEVTDYMGPVAEDGKQEAVARSLAQALADRDDWDTADLRNIPEDSPWLVALSSAAASAGLAPVIEEQDVCPFLSLPASWDEYLEHLPGKLRHEIKRKARKLEAEAGGYTVTPSLDDTLDVDLHRFIELHRSSEGEKGRFMHPGMEIFFRRLGHALAGQGVFRLVLLEVAGEKVAGVIGFAYDDTFYLYNSAFDLGWKQLSPGMVLVGDVIRSCIEEDLRGFDMLKGGLEYKYRFGAVPRRLMRLRLSRKS